MRDMSGTVEDAIAKAITNDPSTVVKPVVAPKKWSVHFQTIWLYFLSFQFYNLKHRPVNQIKPFTTQFPTPHLYLCRFGDSDSSDDEEAGSSGEQSDPEPVEIAAAVEDVKDVKPEEIHEDVRGEIRITFEDDEEQMDIPAAEAAPELEIQKQEPAQLPPADPLTPPKSPELPPPQLETPSPEPSDVTPSFPPTEPTPVIPAEPTPPSPERPPRITTIDLESYDSAESLLSLGADNLKHILSERGLKCGGTVVQRAERLYSVKGLNQDQISKELLATAGKGRKRKA